MRRPILLLLSGALLLYLFWPARVPECDAVISASAAADTDRAALWQRVDSLLTATEGTPRSVYLLLAPGEEGERDRGAPAGPVTALGERFRLGAPVPVRAEVALRRISAARPPAR